MVVTESTKFDPFLTHGPSDPVRDPKATKTRALKSTTTNDGTLRYGEKPPPPPTRSIPDCLLLIFAPWLTFIAVLCLFLFVKYHLPRICWLAVAVLFGLSVAMFVVGLSATNRKAVMYAGVLCAFATILGSLIGLHNWTSTTVNIWRLFEGNSFVNVLPSEGALAYSDAAKLLFADETRIDTTKALGYKEGTMFCVAPVMDDSDLSEIQVWAVGMDCCSPRGYFSCDDSWNSQAHSAVVVHDVDTLMPDLYDHYLKAVKQAQAAYDIESAPKPLFVRWVADPDSLLADWIRYAITVNLISIAVHLLLSIVAGIILSAPQKREF